MRRTRPILKIKYPNYNRKRIKDPLTGKWIWPTPAHKVRNLPLHIHIESRTRVDVVTGCWEWIVRNGKHTTTTGHSTIEKGNVGVGHASWLCFFGPVPKGIDVCHTCDNGHCANPMHLFLGQEKIICKTVRQKGEIFLEQNTKDPN